MTQDKKAPKLRFKGFTDDWEQKKLGDVAKKVAGNDGRLHLPVLTISAKNGWMTQKSRFSNDIAGREKKKYTLLKKNQLSYNHGNSKAAIYGTVYRLNNYNEALVPKVYHSFSMININSKFIELYFHTKKLDKQLRRYISSTARMDGLLNINFDDFMKIYINIPQYSEENKISNLIQKLEIIISTQQRKLDQLKLLKKGLLQKMFADEESKVPEIRFKGFDGEWEQSTLNHIANYRRGSFPQPYGNTKWYGGKDSMPFVQVVDVLDNLKLAKRTKQQISKLAQPKSIFVPKGKVIVTLQGSIGRVAITQYDSYIDRTLLIFEKFNKELETYFWAYTIQKIFNKEKEKAPGGTIKTITKEALSSFKASVPSYNEQKYIGKLLKKVDYNINQNQQKLNQLQQVKKFLLQNMFI